MTNIGTVEPAAVYRALLATRRVMEAALERRDLAFSWARFFLFGAGIVSAWLVVRGRLPFWSIAVPVAIFAAFVVAHDAAIRARQSLRRAVDFYDQGLARIEDRWSGRGDAGERFTSGEHPYAADLDVFGRGSLFELLSLARTPVGAETLAAWLSAPSDPAHVPPRQEAVDELASRVELREALWLSGSAIADKVHSRTLREWAGASPVLARATTRVVATALSILMVLAAVVSYQTADGTAFVTIALLELVFWMRVRVPVTLVLHGADHAARELSALATILRRLEDERFASPLLRRLQEQLAGHSPRASAAIRRLRWLVELHDWEHNAAFGAIAALLVWRVHVACSLEHWRARHGRDVATWLRIAGEFEALASLAAYRFEHPSDVFPEVVADPSAQFDAEALGHPLLPADRMVTNDVSLGREAPLLVVSGSNMSGKSTLLRSVGVAAVMALAGAPVRARRLRVSALQVGGTLRIQDSLQEGRSRFFAEISRIRRLSDLAAQRPPLLFLLDELFHGTNSHDRVLGASGVLRALVDRGAIGLVTTHDLAVTDVARRLGTRALNVHFDDRFEDGELRFDYRMKPGVVTTSNAVALMRAVGLDVPEAG